MKANVPIFVLGAVSLCLAGAAATSVLAGGGVEPQSIEGQHPSTDIFEEYDLVPSFAEEFSHDRLDTSVWTTSFAPRSDSAPSVLKRSLWANGELQVYFDRSYLGLGVNPFRINSGVLRITAEPLDPGSRAAVLADLSSQQAQFRDSALKRVAYSSGVISTRDRFSQKFGYFEMRARWSAGRGIWPAFWLLPKGGGWPPEVDILEAHGDKPRTAFQSIHSSHEPKATTRTISLDTLAQEFHRYGALWRPDRIDYYVDGRITASIPAPPDMGEEMFMVINLAIGGYWPGNPDGSVRFPATMDIDYVRAWRFRKTPSEN